MNVRTKIAGAIAGGAFALSTLTGAAFAQQQSGQVGSGPPEDVFLELTMAEDGTVSLSANEFHFAWGGYYRFNVVCPPNMADGQGVVFYAEDFLENAHIRLISVADTTNPEADLQINFYLQGLQFRKIECEGLTLTPRFSFHPMRKGTYEFRIVNERTDPDIEVDGQFIVE